MGPHQVCNELPEVQIPGLFVLLNQNLTEYGSQESFFNKLLEQLLSALHVDSQPSPLSCLGCSNMHTTPESGLLSQCPARGHLGEL